MTKDEMKAAILEKKDKTGMNWEQIAQGIGMSPVWTTSGRGDSAPAVATTLIHRIPAIKGSVPFPKRLRSRMCRRSIACVKGVFRNVRPYVIN